MVRMVAQASANGATAVSMAVIKRATLGMKYAQNSVTEKETQGITRKGKQLPKGIRYWVGTGAPLGGYPGIRSGQLQRLLNFTEAKPAQRPRAYATSGADYSYYVHSYKDGRDKRPFLTLPVTYSRTFLFTQFRKAFANTMNRGA